MQVVDCVGHSFTAHCRSLSELISPDYTPDLLVAIRDGGLHVAREVHACGAWPDADLVTVSARRPTTAGKHRLRLGLVLSRLPRTVTDQLRVLEHRARVAVGSRVAGRAPTIEISRTTRDSVTRSNRILVVDDAIDSGTTMAAVLEHLGAIGDAEIRSGVLTVTFPAPEVLPDYTVHRGVLLRFPWSHDAGSAA